MFWRRLVYLIVFILSVVAFVLTDSGVALFFCLCLAALPVLSIILLLIAKTRLHFDFSVRPSCMRGSALQITMYAALKPRFLAGFVSAAGVMENVTFDKTDKKVFVFQDMSATAHTFEYVSADSGRIVVRFSKIRITDILGICSVGIKCGKYEEAIVSPVLYDAANVTVGKSSAGAISGDMSLPQRGNDHTEIFGIRDYVPGDLLNSVHWKLSGKFDSIKTKEYGSSDDRHLLILVSAVRIKHDGELVSDEWLNGVLDIAASVSGALIRNGYIHTIGWFNKGKFFCADVTDNDSFVLAVEKLMSVKISENTVSDTMNFSRSPECSVFTKIIYVTAQSSMSVGKDSIGHDLTVLSVENEAGTFYNGRVKVISMPIDGISSSLSSCEL